MQFELNGDTVYASTGGVSHEKDKPTLVFVHGAGMDHTIWVLFNRFFARAGFNTFAIDLPAHGKSEGTALTDIEGMADWLLEALHAAGIKQFSLIGHSMGSLICIDAAAKANNNLTKLVLLGTACPMPVGEPLLDAARSNHSSAIDMIMLFGHAYASQLGGNPVAGVHIVNSSIRLLERALHGPLYLDLNACNEYKGGIDAAKLIKAPTTLILGSEDKMTPRAASNELVATLNNPTVELLGNCGHMMMSEKPELVHRAMVKTLS